jgi:iron complex outermembrane receptor protein
LHERYQFTADIQCLTRTVSEESIEGVCEMSLTDNHRREPKLYGQPSEITRRRTLAAAAATMLLPLTFPALATPDASSAADSEGLEEIVVVGQKQLTSLQKAPESITAITADTLKESNVVTPLDLNGQVPGLVITTSEGYNRSVSIRGIGFNIPQDDSGQPSVSYHEDGIYIVFPVALNSGFLDVDHVEVLRGPQGTVFGQNSIGGTINVISKLPTVDAIAGYLDAQVGSYDLVHTSAAVNLPLSNSIALRAAFDQNYQHGTVIATQVPGANGSYDLNNQNNYHGRLQGLWNVTDDLSVLLRGEYAAAHQHEAQGKNILDPESNPWRESSDWPGRMIYNQQLGAATISYNLPVATLKILSSYQEVNHHGSVNEDGLDLELTSPVHDVEWFLHNTKSITDEVDLSSKPGGVIDWIVGGFYLRSRTTVSYDQYNASLADSYTPNLLQDPGPPSAVTTNAIYSGQLYFQSNAVENRDSYSGYGQATFHITDDLRLTGGARYTRDHNTTYFISYYGLFGPAIFVQQTATKLTYRAAVEYDLTPTSLTYVSLSTGFKPGGGNISLSPLVVPYQFQPETITAYEFGSKNSLLDKRLNVNFSAFLYQDKNMQYQAEDLINYNGGVDNVPHVRVYGLEGEIAALMPYGLRLDGNFTWEKGRITSHFQALDNVSGNAANQEFINLYGYNSFLAVAATGSPALNALRLAAYRDAYGNAPPNLPELMASLNLSHTLPVADGSLLSRIAVQYRSDYADAIFGKTPIYTAPSYVLCNLYFDYKFASGGWDVSLAVNNLTDKAAVLSRFTNQYGGETTQQYVAPREFVVGAHYAF